MAWVHVRELSVGSMSDAKLLNQNGVMANHPCSVFGTYKRSKPDSDSSDGAERFRVSSRARGLRRTS